MTRGHYKHKIPASKVAILIYSIIILLASIYILSGSASAVSSPQVFYYPRGGGGGGGGGYCAGTGYPPCSIFFTAQSDFNTYYSVGTGAITTQQSSQSYVPLINQVLNYNNGKAQWLLTCPAVPNPADTQEYFQPVPNSFVGGDTCLLSSDSLPTQVYLYTSFSWSPNQLANSIASVAIFNIGNANVNNYAYSGISSNPGGSYNISNGYDTKSYIFNNVPSSTQAGVWGWTTQYADLSNANLISLNTSESFSLYINVSESYSNTTNGITTTWTWTCTYPYTYSFDSKVENVQNANAPIPLYYASQPMTFLSYNGMEIPVKTIKTTPASGKISISSCDFSRLHNMYNGCNVKGWKLVRSSGTATPTLYINGTDWNSQSCVTYPGYTSHIYRNSSNTNEFGTVYGSSCIFGLTGWHWGYFNLDIFNTTFTSANVIPFLLYNFTIPSLISNVNSQPEYLNMSYDLYSPHNYLNPANSLDPFPLDTGSGLLVNYNGTLALLPYNTVSISNPNSNGFNAPVSYFLSSLSTSPQEQQPPGSVLPPGLNLPVGTYRAGTIKNATFVALSPNDYIYVANYSAKSNLLGEGAVSYLYTMRFIPLGYFNLSNYNPASIEAEQNYSSPPTPHDYNALYSQWWSSWEGYWSNAIMQQSSDLYITDVNQLSKYSYSCFLWWCSNGKLSGAQFKGFRPTAITTDYAGDVFAVGMNNAGTRDVLNVLYTNNTVVGATINPGFNSSDEIAVTPNGRYIFIANASEGYIAIYQAPSLSEVGEISLNYSNTTASLNISAYLANGGPFNSTRLKNAYRNYATSNDIASYHHPIGLAEYDGILYVLDNWTTSSSSLPYFSVLMLRAFNGNGTEIPVDAFKHYDLVPSNGELTSTASNSSIKYYPPYGWPLSANFSLPNPNGAYISYCATTSQKTSQTGDCTPVSEANTLGYPPIGPAVDLGGLSGPNPNDTGFSSNFNGDLYLITHVTTTSPEYTQLLAFRMNIENYTKISFGAYSPYLCYLNVSYLNSPYCTGLSGDEANVLTQIYPPVLGIPSSFNFSQTNGPMYFNYQNLISTSFPTGVSGFDPPYEPTLSIEINPVYQGTTDNIILTANSLVPNDALSLQISNATKTITETGTGNIIYTENTLPVGDYIVKGCDDLKDSCASNQILSVISQPSVTIPPSSAIPTSLAQVSSYLNSHINGYILVPYNLTYSLEQNYTPNPDYNGYVSSGSPPTIGENGFEGPDCPPYYFTNSTNYYVQYASLPISVQSASLNSTIQGGGTYIEYTNQKYYDANVSDANLILPPSTFLTMFTNRVFGDVYINQTVTPQGALPVQYVLNASLDGVYFMNNFVQNNYFGPFDNIYPGFSEQEYNSIPHVLSPLPKLPQGLPYYYNNLFILNYPNAFNYSNFTRISFVSLFNIYRYATYQNNLELNITGSPDMGYNRLIFTYVDQFNNTIYMPLDVDFANITSINMNVTTSVNALNPNETTVTVNGVIASISSSLNPVPVPLPKNTPIYIYYDANINFYNSTIPYTTPSYSIIPYLDYCAFSPNSNGCSLANYLSPKLYSGIETNTTDYSTQFNSTGQCAPEPKSLLVTGNFLQCNIYPQNKFNLPQYGMGADAQPEYCVPVYPNGTGYLTSQLGLVHIAKTNANGDFSYSFNVCGTGNDKVTTTYYGWPPPEPINFTQTPISQAANFFGCFGATCQKYPEYNYSNAPASASQSFNIGLYELSFGNISGYGIPLLAVAVVAALVIISLRSSKPPKLPIKKIFISRKRNV